MKTDRELLELAAKAAGIEVTAVVADGIPHRFGSGYWNPLTDDGDALRLAVELNLVVEPGRVWLHKNPPVFGAMFAEAMFQCPMLATRRAIVRAAAVIGESMP